MADKNGDIIETTGSLSKKEVMVNLEEEFCNGILALETLYPYPGYYHKTIPDKKAMNPRSLFLITKEAYPDERIIRAHHAVKKTFRKKFDAAPGEITLFNEPAPCIRVKMLDDYHELPALIGRFEDQGIKFMKYRKVNPYKGIMKIKKFFSLVKLQPGIFKDSLDPNMAYFQITVDLSWDKFEEIVLAVKRNIEDNKFDAALGAIFLKNCLVDMIRIYDEEMETEKLVALRNKFTDEITKAIKA